MPLFKLLLLLSSMLNSSDAAKVQILLNHPLAQQKPLDQCQSNACRPLLAAINNAHSSIDFAIYGMQDQTAILEALVAAKQRGVRIRAVVDKDIHNQNYYRSTAELISRLGNVTSDYLTDLSGLKLPASHYKSSCKRPKNFNGPVQCVGYSLPNNQCLIAAMASKEPITFTGDLMHNKFFIIDERIVWTGSTNISASGTGGYNANIAILINDKTIALAYKKEFEQMFVAGKYHRKKKLSEQQILTSMVDNSKIQLAFSPQSGQIIKEIRRLINNAEQYIDLPMFYLTHKKLSQDLINAHLRGVKVRVIIDATAAQNEYSKHQLLRAAGIALKVENWGSKMHMKVAVIDGKYLVTGSMNWTNAGERNNDENILIIHNSAKATAVHNFFNQLWHSIPDKWLYADPDPESLDSGSSCFDAVDNDFDNKIDAADEGCNGQAKPVQLPPFKIVPKAAGHDLIKGVVTKSGIKLFIKPNHKKYDAYKISHKNGWQWFCSDMEAIDAGYKAYR